MYTVLERGWGCGCGAADRVGACPGRQADAECQGREFSRTAARRLPERELVLEICGTRERRLPRCERSTIADNHDFLLFERGPFFDRTPLSSMLGRSAMESSSRAMEEQTGSRPSLDKRQFKQTRRTSPSKVHNNGFQPGQIRLLRTAALAWSRSGSRRIAFGALRFFLGDRFFFMASGPP